jgi:hypothetical protein
MRCTGVLKIVKGRDWAADAQHMKSNEHGQRLRPESKHLLDAEIRAEDVRSHDVSCE